MKVVGVQGISFKNSLVKPLQNNASGENELTESQKLRQKMEESGLTSKYVKSGAIAGALLGFGYSIGKQSKVLGVIMNTMCMSGLGIIIGKGINYFIKKYEKQ